LTYSGYIDLIPVVVGDVFVVVKVVFVDGNRVWGWGWGILCEYVQTIAK
jgi:hypothetical protein